MRVGEFVELVREFRRGAYLFRCKICGREFRSEKRNMDRNKSCGCLGGRVPSISSQLLRRTESKDQTPREYPHLFAWASRPLRKTITEHETGAYTPW